MNEFIACFFEEHTRPSASMELAGAARSFSGQEHDSPKIFNHLGLDLCSQDEPLIEGPFCVLFSGRLDHRRDLIEELGLACDASKNQVLLAAWHRWQTDCADHFSGDFALLVWDGGTRRLFGARDALGARTLYYTRTKGMVAVSSATRPLLHLSSVSPVISRRGVMVWLQGNYDERIPLYESIQGLPYGHYLLAEQGRIVALRYWNPGRIAPLPRLAESEYRDLFLECFDRCVADRCPGEGEPVVSMLSGGLDSTSVTASAVHRGKNRVLPLSFKFETMPECDESELSLVTARHLGLEPHWLPCENDWLFKSCLDDGRQRENAFLTWETLEDTILNYTAQQGAQVLLTGHGGDNLITGIPQRHNLGKRLRCGNLGALFQLRRGGLSFRRSIWRYLISPILPQSVSQFLRPDGVASPPPWLKEESHELWHETATFLRYRPKFFVAPERQASYEFTVSMANGIRRIVHYYHHRAAPYGVRVGHPFFDRRLVELILSLPPEILRMNDQNKGFLRYCNIGRLPEALLVNQRKPSLLSFYHYGVDKEKKQVKILMEDSVLADMGFIEKKTLQTTVESYLEGSQENIATFVTALMVENWLRNERSGGLTS